MLKNISIVTIGEILAKIIGILASLIIARLYSPNDVGFLYLILSIASIIAILSTGRYEQAIPLEQEDANASALLMANIILAIFNTLIISLIFFFLFNLLGISTSNNISEGYWYLLSITIVIGLQQTFLYWCIRLAAFQHQGASRIITIFSTSALQIALGYNNPSSFTLFSGDLIGRLIGVFILTLPALRILQSNFKTSSSLIYRMCSKHWRFPLYVLPSALLQTLLTSSPPIIINMYYSDIEVGYWAMSQYFISAIGVLSVAIASVFYSRVSQMAKENPTKLMSFYLRSLIFLFATSIFYSIFILFFGKDLIILILGEKWIKTADYLIIMLPATISLLLGSTWQALNIFNRQNWGLIINISGFLILAITSLLLNDAKISDLFLIKIFSLSITFTYTSLTLALYFAIKEHTMRENNS